MPPHIRRHRFPAAQGMRLVALLAAFLGVMACGAIVLAVVAIVRVDGQVRALGATQAKLERAQQATFDARRGSAFNGCELREDLKGDVRLALRYFGADLKDLPRRRDGRRPFAPLGHDGCRDYARAIVPDSNRP